MRRRTQLAVALGVAALAAGIVVFRLTDQPDTSPPPPTSTPPPPASVVTEPEPATHSTADAPASTAAPAGSDGEGLPIDPSNTRRTATAEGARRSAIDYLSTVRQRLVYLTDDAARELLGAWIAPGAAVTLVDAELTEATTIRTTLAADGGEVWWLVTPLATRIDAIDGDRARVSVWLTTIAASGVDPTVSDTAIQPMVRFQIDTVELIWTETAGWSVWSITSVDGPTPMTAPSSQLATIDTFIGGLDGFTPTRSHH